jgi:hypothetical protein
LDREVRREAVSHSQQASAVPLRIVQPLEGSS